VRLHRLAGAVPSSTITFCWRSENETKLISTCPLEPYFRKSAPVAAYFRIAARNVSGGIQSSLRPVPTSHVSLTRLAKALLTCAAEAPRKSALSGPSKPMMFPAR
jgi:hypothetical protein